MKRILTVVTAALLILAICTACGSAKSADLKALMDEINTACGLTDMKAVEDAESLNRYYQIEADSIRQFAAELPSSSKDFNEIILIEAVDENAAAQIKTLLDARLRSQLSNAKSYSAEQVGMIESCETKQSGNYVYLVIGEKHDEIDATIAEALK
ncbi:MAG: DUF4358 domain-containing protein [Ruminococcus sp.]|nr:DUF4358 domain-containing protein [Ruminococcus sp.]